MIISKKEYDALTPEEKSELRYSNPCIYSETHIRVGEVFDDELGYWKPAQEWHF